MSKQKFEDALHRLEDIVEKLEEGNLGLEESLKIFEEGIKLSRFCAKKLDEAEKRIQVLMKDEKGELRETPFQQDEENRENFSDNDGGVDE